MLPFPLKSTLSAPQGVVSYWGYFVVPVPPSQPYLVFWAQDWCTVRLCVGASGAYAYLLARRTWPEAQVYVKIPLRCPPQQ